MNQPTIVSYVLATTLVLAAGCKRAESSANPPAATNGAAPTVQPAMPVPVAARVAPAAPAGPAVDPRWPRWMPPISGVRVRMASADFVEGGADSGSLELLIQSRRACEQAGFTVSQTNIQRTRWDQKFVFTCTRAQELLRVELTGQPARPNYTSFNACQGDFARAMMRRRTR
ncbi:MAG: hypothetical protein Q8S73_02895 [Deltaproteobacteria bacterium]|nr:hypothetical protein [Myxococcales bacterium]MDP3213026.1 hypothetical protein [Deltaproteobacteria bacterium]